MEIYLSGRPQVTFLKSVYRRHTDCITKREQYEFIDGKVVIPNDENISAIQKIWVVNWKNIKKLHLLMISNSVDVDELNMSNITESTSTVKVIDYFYQ